MLRDKATQVVIDGLSSNTQYQIQAIAITSTEKRSIANETMIKATEPGILDFPGWAIGVIAAAGLVLLFGALCFFCCCRE